MSVLQRRNRFGFTLPPSAPTPATPPTDPLIAALTILVDQHISAALAGHQPSQELEEALAQSLRTTAELQRQAMLRQPIEAPQQAALPPLVLSPTPTPAKPAAAVPAMLPATFTAIPHRDDLGRIKKVDYLQGDEVVFTAKPRRDELGQIVKVTYAIPGGRTWSEKYQEADYGAGAHPPRR